MDDRSNGSISTELPAPAVADSSVDKETHCCVVCLSEPEEARLCKQCAQLFCRDCLERSYQTSRRCPHCRGNFHLDAYVRVPWISDLLKTVRSLPPKIAQECPTHPRKFLVNYCNDCDKSCCATCWTDSHTNHIWRPIEVANSMKRVEIQEVLGRLRDHVDGLIQSRRLHSMKWRQKRALFQMLKREGDALTEDCPNQMKDTWSRKMHRMEYPESATEAALECAHAAASSIKTSAGDSHLNVLVDEFVWLRMEAEKAIKENDIADVIAFYESIDNQDVLQYFSSYLPGWDVKETVTVKNCKRLLTSSAKRCVAQWTVNGITWSLWIANRARDGDCTKDKAAFHCKRFWLGLSVYVTMTGRKELKNYALRLDDVPQTGFPSEIVCHHTINEGEELVFPIGSPLSWFTREGHLAFVFKVRPLDYRQKCIDQEIYFRSLMGSKAGRENVQVIEMEADSVSKAFPGSSGIPTSSNTATQPKPTSAANLRSLPQNNVVEFEASGAPRGSSDTSDIPSTSTTTKHLNYCLPVRVCLPESKTSTLWRPVAGLS